MSPDEGKLREHGLTRREYEILRHVAMGRTNPEIADALGLTRNTVKTYLQRTLEKLGARNRVEALARANQLGILQLARWPRWPRTNPVSHGSAGIRAAGRVDYRRRVITFAVDDVVPADARLPDVRLGGLVRDAVVGHDPDREVLEPDGVHPLLSAVARAFAGHHPLVLSPDAVWLTIVQGLAQHVRLHAEELRPHLVGHAGRKALAVAVDGPMPRDAASWRDVVEALHKAMAAEATDADVFECDFSTSTDVERIAGRVVMFDAYSPYFSLWMVFVCGIPSITLTGTVADWQRIRDRVPAVAAFGLERWCRSLAPIADQFVRAAAGDVDTAFWRRVHNPRDAYGGERITGWVARFYPYLRDHTGTVSLPNPLLDLPIDEPRDVVVDEYRGYQGPGVRSDDVPATLSRAVVHVNDRVSGENRSMALHAGLVGVAQDAEGRLTPVAGWHLTPADVEIDDVLDAIVDDHEVTPPSDELLWEATADLAALYRRMGSASLFGGSWRLLPVAEHRHVLTPARTAGGRPRILVVAELPDGRHLGTLAEHGDESGPWLTCRIRPGRLGDTPGHTTRPTFVLVDDPAEVPTYGTSLAFLLRTALDNDGDIALAETGRLSDLLRP